MGFVTAWLQERIPVSGDQLRELTNEPVPNHLKRWWFCLGGTPAYCFVVQIVTGILLAFYYSPSPRTAYESIDYITNEAAFGAVNAAAQSAANCWPFTLPHSEIAASLA